MMATKIKIMEKRDKGLMIVSIGIIIVGLIGLFVNQYLGGITLFVGVGMFLMGYLSQTP